MPAPVAVEKQGFGGDEGVVVDSVSGFFEVEGNSGHHCYLQGFIIIISEIFGEGD